MISAHLRRILIFALTIIQNHVFNVARLAQSVEHETLNLRVVGSSPTLGALFSRKLHENAAPTDTNYNLLTSTTQNMSTTFRKNSMNKDIKQN